MHVYKDINRQIRMNLRLLPELCIVWHMYDIMHAAQKAKRQAQVCHA